ncbi:glycosyltransferase family 2 protein [Lapidilactobacillus bayanensis]|uniref:glycosyltransferase family 2 protein n=1 Tax=Lapidilactobacillus bayanensis TaxID=2485998 RepID=UPI000F7A5403|nr:glycosyltransferase family 2 protein [Lapidilactobacillus bayanensis]
MSLNYSIIIPVHNAKRFLTDLLQQLHAINYQGYECLLIENGSTDGTWEMLTTLTADDEICRAFQIPPHGPGAARNYGIEHAQGKYVLFLDADDPVQPDILWQYDQVADQDDDDLIISSFQFDTMRDNQVVVSQKYQLTDHLFNSQSDFFDQLYDLMNRQFAYVIWNKRYRLALLIDHQIRFPEFFSCEDRIFNIRYFEHCQTVYTTSKILAIYRYDAAHGLTTRYDPHKFATFKQWYQEAVDLLGDRALAGISALYLKGLTSTIFSIIRTKKIDRQHKKGEVQEIYHDPSVRQAKKEAITDSKIKHLTKILYAFPFPLFYIAVSVGSSMEYRLPSVIEKFKRNY